MSQSNPNYVQDARDNIGPNGDKNWLLGDRLIDMGQSVVESTDSLGLRSKPGEQISVPAWFEMPGQDGKTKEFILVKREGSAGVRIELQAIRDTRNGKRAKGKAVELPLPKEDQKTSRVEIGNAKGDITTRRLFGKSALGKTVGFGIGDQALQLEIGHDGSVLASVTRHDERIVRMQAGSKHYLSAKGVVGVPHSDPRHAGHKEYMEQQAQVQAAIEAREEEARRVERRRDELLYVPRPGVIDETRGGVVPDRYEGPVVTEASRAFAREWIRTAVANDEQIAEILHDVVGNVDLGDDNVVDSVMDRIRTDLDLRVSIGSLVKKEVLSSWVRSHAQDIRKASSHVGMEYYANLHMTDTEYVGLMALAHMDGTFIPGMSDERNDSGYDIQRDDDGKHRTHTRWYLSGRRPYAGTRP